MGRVLYATVVAALVVTGCRSKGPTPQKEQAATPPPVGSTETSGAHPGRAEAAGGQPDASGVITVGAVAFKVPKGWQAQAPESSMRRAQLVAPGNAELIVYYFGEQGAGAAKANVERWIGQFTKADGSPVDDAKETKSEIAGFDVVKVDVQGQYAGGMGPRGQAGAPKADQRLLAAIVTTSAGPYYFKFLGPTAAVTEQASAFDDLLASMQAP